MPNSRTALLVMDVQPTIVARLENPEEYLARARAAVEAARSRRIPVIYVVVGFRAGIPEVSESNKTFSTIKTNGAPGMIDPRPVIEPADGDIVVTKRRVSAFTGSDLEVVLRAQEIRHLVLAGISTSGVVLSTTREAADKDYRLTILSDLCHDADPEVHRVLTEKIFPRQADVTSSAAWIQSLG